MRLAVVGAAGRMGQALVRAVASHDETVLHVAIERAGSPAPGADAGTLSGLPPLGVPVTDHAPEGFLHADGVLDFTTPDATVEFARIAAQARIVHVIGTTGCDETHDAALDAAARHARVVKSGNMSLGVNLLAALTKQVAARLGEEFDIEILDMHHRHKVDAPSGTALLLGEAAAEGREIDLKARGVLSREGQTGARNTGDIGFATLRGGAVVGEHRVIFAGEAEQVVLTHKASDRGLFANGAVKAALWARTQKPGRYDMMDVLGL